MRPIRHRSPFFLTLAALLGLALVPARTNAQTVHGQVVTDDTGEPVPGAMVVLAAPGGARHGATIADSLGRFRITARAPGTFTLAAERVGYGSLRPDTVTLAAGQTVERPLRAGARRVTLPPVTVQARNRCEGRVEANPYTALVWEEARKALAAAVQLEDDGYHFWTEVQRREVRLRDLGEMNSHGWVFTSSGSPFATLPAERVVDGGYVAFQGDSIVLYGVGPAVVLSEDFRRRHCFGLRDGGAEHVGLEFVPLRTGGRPDVRGTLWIDRATGELRTLEFTYTGLEFRGPAERLGGELRFIRLPSGAWIVSEWVVRGPLLRRSTDALFSQTSMSRFRIWALRETAGRVLSIQPPDGAGVRLQEGPSPSPSTRRPPSVFGRRTD
ncbi:MAG TPA: carboxypeptidase-like regulatory domain-containing protein [Longimicrobium sp.]|jgi:hypothetical protein|uniref:carboxypeptidase-like regulatory domain-containing protein n=1 Tax=Longimicrobium sp. TaxID=2029185 RepID=UPI002ED8B533